MSRERVAVAAVALLLAACASTVERAEELAARGEWSGAVLEYRKALAKNNGNVEFRSRLKQTELQAAEFYYHHGKRLAEDGDLDGALAQFQQGLSAMPEHAKLRQAVKDILALKEAQAQFGEGERLAAADKKSEASAKFRQALETYPQHEKARRALDELRNDQLDREKDELLLKTREPITLNFRQSDLKQAFEFLGKSFGINIIFDEAIKSVPVTVFAKDVTFDQGLNLLLSVSKSFYRKIGPNSILIAPDTKEKRGQYEDHVVRTFQLNSIKAKEMADILKGLMTIKKIIVNDYLNTIVVRDTDEIVKLAERIVEANDRKPAELVLEVEILEINRTKAEKLGLDLGTYQVSAAVPAYKVSTPFSGAIDSALITLPSATLRFYKQDVDAKTLANPKVRVVHGKAAKIHIGDRVPLRAAIIQDATGQVRTTFDYREIGIRLVVEPEIHVDNSTTVKLGLEVSSLGENLGTANEPAYRIGTRNAETVMLLRDGETAILGGLIRDDERNTRVRLPGLGSIPLIGSLFTSYDDSGGRSDVLLTITPRVVRGWDTPTNPTRQFYSGSENVYTTKPVFALLDGAAQLSMSDVTTSATTAQPADAKPGRSDDAQNRIKAQPADRGATIPSSSALPVDAALAFSSDVFEVTSGQEVTIDLLGVNLDTATSLQTDVLFNPQVVEFVRAEKVERAERFEAAGDVGLGRARLSVGFSGGSSSGDKQAFARLTLRATRPGLSYLVYQTPRVVGKNGEVINAQIRAARIVVR